MPIPLIIGSNGYVAAIDVMDGRELWRTKLQTGVFTATAHSDVSVLVQGGFVLAGSRGHLFCLDVENGTVLWHNELQGMGYNDVSLAMQNVSVQFLQKVERSHSGPSQ
jgi:outer membrane protein assembly factor BamB